MTIAACHLSPEGVVLGADSATTMSNYDTGRMSHLDYAQKVFEVGPEGASIGLVTWGLGQIGVESHRTIVANIGFRHAETPYTSVRAMADALATDLWTRFNRSYVKEIIRVRALHPRVKGQLATPEEFKEYLQLVQTLAGGYCLAGRVQNHGPCEAYTILWDVLGVEAKVKAVVPEKPMFWGIPEIMYRLIYGFDSRTIADILASGKWTGTQEDLLDVIEKNQLISPRLLPIREAIDWVHTVIHTTIRGTKFANWPHLCGGPVELAVITTDRPFRWVRHKMLDAAIITAEETR